MQPISCITTRVRVCVRVWVGVGQLSTVCYYGTVKECKLLEALLADTGVTTFEPARGLNAKMRESKYQQGYCCDVSFIA